ncbi:hypothetical protein ABIA32_006340 [Streptacidiphilus sp. MAP12-20]|uniref:hypothetical protein n=1 Tax=Streptacidiphilus sp. MAP12-20 TaxID=3156299 RepID=UPI003513A39F
MLPFGLASDNQVKAFTIWREQADQVDRERGEVYPADQLHGWLHCQAVIGELQRLVAGPCTPAALVQIRRLLRSMLSVVPQPGPDQNCHIDRWKSRGYRQVCRVLTCGRCAPIRAAEPGRHWAHPRSRAVARVFTEAANRDAVSGGRRSRASGGSAGWTG